MRTLLFAITLFAMSTFTLVVQAWDGPQQWYASPTGKEPGGGGIMGTGSVQDHSVTCAACHIDAKGKIDLKFTFTPPLAMVAGNATYSPGQKYDIKADLVGEYLGLSGCAQYMTHTNNFAAELEDANGKSAGTLQTSSGFTSTSCQPTVDPKTLTGNTVTYGDCRSVIAFGDNRSSWNFSWTAPTKGLGTITLYWGAVDGDCDMNSQKDDVKVGTLKMGEASARNDRGSSNAPFAFAVVLPAFGFIARRIRKGRERPRG